MKIIISFSKILLYPILSLTIIALFSCSLENNKGEAKKSYVTSNDTALLVNKQQIEVWYFDKVSEQPIMEGGKNIEIIKNELLNTTITLEGSMIYITDFCSGVEYVDLKKKSLDYFTNQDNMNRYSRELLKNEIKISDSLNIIRSAIPSEECDYPFGEILKMDNNLIILYEGYLVFFSKEKISEKNEKKVEQNLQTSEIQLPYNKKIDIDRVSYRTISTGKISGLKHFSCEEDVVRYIPICEKNNIHIILVPQDCADFPYRFFLLTVFDNIVKDNIYVEGEWYEPDNDVSKEITTFSIDKDYNVYVKTQTSSSSKVEKYTITNEGKIIKH